MIDTVLNIKVTTDPQGVMDVDNLIRKLRRVATRGTIPRGFYSTIHWFMEEIFQQGFDRSGRVTLWPISRRVERGLGDPRTLVAAGKLMRSLGHNSGELGIRDVTTGAFGSVLNYGGNFSSGYNWSLPISIGFDEGSREYTPSTGNANVKQLYAGGRSYFVPPRNLFETTTADSDWLKRLLVRWLHEYSKKGVRGNFRVIGTGGIEPV